MITGFLALVVAFFVSKSLGTLVIRLVAQLLGHGVTKVAEAGGRVGAKVSDTIGKGISDTFNKPQTSTAMAGFVVNTEDFGKVVFGSEEKLIDAVSAKTVEAIAEKLSTEKGQAEVAKRLASVSKQKKST